MYESYERLKSPIVDTEKYLNELVDMGYLEIIKKEQKSVYILKKCVLRHALFISNPSDIQPLVHL